MVDLTILKIGGSVITYKDEAKRLKRDVIDQVTKEVTDTSCGRLILVHGAGSFGHPQAAKHFSTERDLLKDAFAVFDINKTVIELNTVFISSLIEYGAPALPLHPMNFTLLENGRIHSMMIEHIEEMLKQGFIPVLHGDVVLDRTRSYSILSGDQIVSYLARKLQAKRVGLGADVDGVMDGAGKVIEHITPQNVDKIEFREGAANDVTGAMRGKVTELLELADYGISSYIFNGKKRGNIKRWLEGEKIVSTVISE
ncbi:MAG: isopentenyl phosphate kinase [Candidatus Syntropharchaeales archaeon]